MTQKNCQYKGCSCLEAYTKYQTWLVQLYQREFHTTLELPVVEASTHTGFLIRYEYKLGAPRVILVTCIS